MGYFLTPWRAEEAVPAGSWRPGGLDTFGFSRKAKREANVSLPRRAPRGDRVRTDYMILYVHGEAHFERRQPGGFAGEAIRETARRLGIGNG